MKRSDKRRLRQLSYRLPRWSWLYRVCKLYVDNYRGSSNADMLINGEMRLLRSVIPHQTGAILDIGANRGQWTAAVLSLSPNAHIHCFEPSPATFAQLQARNFPPHVTLNPVGVGAAPGVLPLHIYGDGSELDSIYRHGAQTPNRIVEVDITTVDAYCQTKGLDQVGFVKVDVEGHDFAVIQGARSLLERGGAALLQFEYGAHWVIARCYLKDVFEFTSSLPYQLFRVMPFGLAKITRYHYKLDNFEHANYILARHDNDLPDTLRVISE